MPILDKKAYLQKVLEFTSAQLHKKNLDAFEINCSYDQGHAVSVRDQLTETLEFNITQQMSVTVYHHGKTGYAETSDLSEKSILAIIDNAKTIATYTENDPFCGVVDKKFLCTPQEMPSLYKPIADFSIHHLIEHAKNCEHIALKHKGIDHSEGVDIDSFEILHGFANSHGFLHVYPETRHSLGIGLIAKDQHGMQRDSAYFSAHDFAALPNIHEITQLAIKRTLDRRNPRRIKSQKLPILLSPSIARSFWRALMSAIKGQRQYHKDTFLLNKVGHQILPTSISLIENPYIHNALGNQPFDDEGVNFGENPIVIEGVLKRYLLSSYSARQLNLETTGNSGGMSNLLVQSKERLIEHDQLIKQLDKGIIVHETMGQGFNLTTGDYSQGAMGYYVEKGEIQYPIDNFTIAGNLNAMFQDIIAIGNDIEPFSRIRSGSVLINQCSISGE
ncbi:metallopeptidase TldD-related protein [Caedibacter taeniospiralis]|jgi:PmbA protein|uniref:metallopeptidase TldD-related protein n=1 Tax=Caedibacter taeniospiralis TaxID=28907 RepID=UPI0037BF6F16